MGLIDRITNLFKQRQPAAAPTTIEEHPTPTRPFDGAELFRVERERSAIIEACREMYRGDMRVKRIIGTLARDAVRGGFEVQSQDARAVEAATAMITRVKMLDRLDDWMRLALRDGDMLLEIGVNAQAEITVLTRKPTLEMRRNSDVFDQFADPLRAFWWSDQLWMGQNAPKEAIWFAQWQIVHARWAHDDGQRYGTPLFAEAVKAYRRLDQGETDIAIRRKTRAGMRYHHVVEGDEADIERYKTLNQAALDQPFAAKIDFFSNKEGGISTIQGDANLDQIGDVMHHLRSFWTASPIPMSLIGYGEDLNRDILNEQKEQYDDDLPTITKWVEDEIVRPVIDLQLLLAGILPESADYTLAWAKRKVLTPTMLRDLSDAALRLRAFGLDDQIILTLIGQFIPDVDLSQVVLGGGDVERLAAQGSD